MAMSRSSKAEMHRLSKSKHYGAVVKAMHHGDALGAGAKARKHLHGQDKVHVVMKEFKRGTLHSGSGAIVRDRDQAIAIAMSEAGLSKKK